MRGATKTRRRSRFGSFWTDYEAQREIIGQDIAVLPVGSDVEFLGNIESVIEFDAEVSDGAFHLGMAEQQLDGP